MPRYKEYSFKKYKKIQRQFKERMKEKTQSGALPSSASVVQGLAEDWCLSERRVREILNIKVND